MDAAAQQAHLVISHSHALQCQRDEGEFTLAFATRQGLSIYCIGCRRRHIVPWETLHEEERALQAHSNEQSIPTTTLSE